MKLFSRFTFALGILLLTVILFKQNTLVHAAISDAAQIELNKSLIGNITNHEEDYYKFTLPSDGNVSLQVKQQSGRTWYAQIQDSSGKIYENLYTDNSELVEGYAVSQVGLPKGTYYLKIMDYYNDNGKYEFKVNFLASKFFEKESNDSITYANQMILNQNYKGSMKDSGDDDFYKIYLPTAGNVTLYVKQKSNVQWYTHIQNSKGEIYESLYTDDSELVEGYAKVQVGLPKGNYYINISDSYNTDDIPYEIKTVFNKSTNYEKEFNNSLTAANAMNVNQTYKGSISNYYDTDVYKITLPSNGNVTLSMKQSAGASWYAHIQDSKGNIYEDLYTDYSELVKGYAKTQIGLPKGTYYIKVSDSNNSYDLPYEIKASFTASTVYEREFNDNLTSANSMKLNKFYYGRLSNSSDKDIFKFIVPTDGNVSLYMKQLADASWHGHIQNSHGDVYTDLYTNSDDLVSGYASTKLWLKKGTYYFVMQDSFNSYDRPYEFKISMKSNPLSASKIKVYNNKGKSDSVSVRGVAKGDVVKIYNTSSKGTLLATKESTDSYVSLSIKQLGQKGGKIYVTVTKSGLAESDRVAVSFAAEKK
ncbi:hypothetical protein KUV80_10910 [Fictibacillus nanhaiensis]|uniref:hypothetical protein n=1 Tax=Fictibacillus nanhaiensis TaxID=742169 RepID=UPI001C985DE7|nr:hypothetical protein [Fictibacillus nanhaiensis]MBY6037169.1 hypothetical protein [Fictibacillus nanhaiensis]